MNANNAEGENCKIITRFSALMKVRASFCNASIHVNGKYDETSSLMSWKLSLTKRFSQKQTPKRWVL